MTISHSFTAFFFVAVFSSCTAFAPSHHHVVIAHPAVHHQQPSTFRTRDLSLQMGIRSFIKKRILRRDGGDSGSADELKKDPQDISLRTVLQNPNSSGLMESPVQSSYNDDDESSSRSNGQEEDSSALSKGYTGRKRNKAIDDILTHDMKQRLQEDAKDRIRRVQAGGMTEEEKMSFLNTALTRTLPPKKPRGPPIRQKIPSMEDDDADAGAPTKRGGSTSKGGSSSKSDNLWSAITGKGAGAPSSGGKADYVPVSSLVLDGKLRNEEAKRQWINSITNPDRFASFSSIQRDSSTSDESLAEEVINEVNQDEGDAAEGSVDAAVGEEAGEQDFTEMKRKMSEDRDLLLLNKQKAEKPGEQSVRQALESILTMASKNDNKAKTAASSPASDSKKNDLAERLEKAAIEQENREAENRAALEKKKAEEKQALLELQREREAKFLRQEADRMEEARKKVEQQRLEEEAKKEAERAKLEAAVAAQDAYWANQLKKQQAKREASMSLQERRKIEQQNIVKATESEELFERDVAKDVKREQLKDEERMRQPKHEGEILSEAEEEKLHDRERARDIIDDSVAKVSRTVVKPSKEDASVSAFVQEQRKKKEELDKLAEVQRQQLKMLNSPLSPAVPRPPPAVAKPPITKSTPTSSPDLSLSSLTMKKSSQSPPSKESTSPRTIPASNLASAARTAVKRPVRQQLPITRQDDDDDEEDDENLMKKGGAGLTVADALKQRKDGGGDKSSGGKKALNADDRAKQWGIDMSKFK